VTIRRALPTDARAIAEVQVGTWRAAYAGLIDEEVLAGLSVDERARQFRAWLGGTMSARHFVAEDAGAIVGFCTVATPARDTSLGVRVAEIAAIYVVPDRWREGIGTALVDATTASLRDDGYTAVVLWTLRANERAAGFYAARGFAPDGAQRHAAAHARDEVRYRASLASG
jgi:GNAT superfamily N-acetyltransferase